MYSNPCGKKAPGLLIFMIDGGASMMTDYHGTSSRGEFVIRCVNEILHEIVSSCTNGIQIKNNVYIHILTYESGGTRELLSGYIGNLVDSAIKNSIEQNSSLNVKELHETQKPIILKSEFSYIGGATHLDEAYESAHELILSWIDSLEDMVKEISPVPLVLNFTKGTIHECNHNLMDIVNSIKKIRIKDGHPLLYTVLVPLWDERKDLICTNETMTMGDETIFWEISSFVPQEHKNYWLNNEKLQKGIILNPENSHVIWRSLVQPWIRPPYYNTSFFKEIYDEKLSKQS